MSASPKDETAPSADDLNGREALPYVIWEGKLFGLRVYVLSTGERVIDGDDLEAFFAPRPEPRNPDRFTEEAIELLAELQSRPPWPSELARDPGETDEGYLERVRPFLDRGAS